MLSCDLCGGRLIAEAGGRTVCSACGMEYSKERIREMLSNAGQTPIPNSTSSTPTASFSTLTIERDKDGGCFLVPLTVIVDNAQKISLKHGTSEQIQLEEGRHSMQFSNIYSEAVVTVDIAHCVDSYALTCKVGMGGKINLGSLQCK